MLYAIIGVVVVLLVLLALLPRLTKSRLTDEDFKKAGKVPPSRPTSAKPAREPAKAPETAAPVEVPANAELAEPTVVERPNFRDRLGKTRSKLAGLVGSLTGKGGMPDDVWDELEEGLLTADVGVAITDSIITSMKAKVKAGEITTPDDLSSAIKADFKSRLDGFDRELHYSTEGQPTIWLFVGVNGVGKTTTIGKLGLREFRAGKKVVMAAGDTFRAAATQQLEVWGERAGAEVIKGQDGGDPASVIYDAVQHGAATKADLVLGDTAGRLQNKTNLMEELRKIRRIAERDAGVVTETLLVLDAITGQNGLEQAKVFTEAVELTGVVLTKLDGSAKGGVVLAIHEQLGIPVKLVGLGETAEDLIAFDPDEFVEALLS